MSGTYDMYARATEISFLCCRCTVVTAVSVAVLLKTSNLASFIMSILHVAHPRVNRIHSNLLFVLHVFDQWMCVNCRLSSFTVEAFCYSHFYTLVDANGFSVVIFCCAV